MVKCRHEFNPKEQCPKCRRHAAAMAKIDLEHKPIKNPAPHLSPVLVEKKHEIS